MGLFTFLAQFLRKVIRTYHIHQEVNAFKKEMWTLIDNRGKDTLNLSNIDFSLTDIEDEVRFILSPKSDSFYRIPNIFLEETENIKLALYREILDLQKEEINGYFPHFKQAKQTELERMIYFQYQKKAVYEDVEKYFDLKEQIRICQERIKQIDKLNALPQTSTLSSKISKLKKFLKKGDIDTFHTQYLETFGDHPELIFLYEKYQKFLIEEEEGTIKPFDAIVLKMDLVINLLNMVDKSYEDSF